MAIAKMGTAVPWSYSSLQAYETCPRRFYLTRILKIVSEKQTEATKHGNEVHSALEKYVAGKAKLPDGYAQWTPIADAVRTIPGKRVLEYKVALTRALKPTEYFAKDVWVRAVLDVGIAQDDAAYVFDWKTGKRKDDPGQLKLFAGVAFAVWPHIKKARTAYIWLLDGTTDRAVYERDDMQPIFQEFAGRVQRMEESQANNDWPPRPSGLCRAWCPVGKSNCEHCGVD